ncbi:hypothetical protein NQ318_001028 [Aromia moschata]|uniref:Uncharacterized protein n=1 Tax=Aromia moschata TaxID=1265417 RepID=A0AAV8ZFD7_9CUCU|nr:hypothetical protein NQ318_001028 [Aromia moschata]
MYIPGGGYKIDNRCESPHHIITDPSPEWDVPNKYFEENVMRQKAKQHISTLLDEMVNAMNKLTMLDREWPSIMHGFVQNTLLDYSQLDLYMKQKIQDLNK